MPSGQSSPSISLAPAISRILPEQVGVKIQRTGNCSWAIEMFFRLPSFNFLFWAMRTLDMHPRRSSSETGFL